MPACATAATSAGARLSPPPPRNWQPAVPCIAFARRCRFLGLLGKETKDRDKGHPLPHVDRPPFLAARRNTPDSGEHWHFVLKPLRRANCEKVNSLLDSVGKVPPASRGRVNPTRLEIARLDVGSLCVLPSSRGGCHKASGGVHVFGFRGCKLGL